MYSRVRTWQFGVEFCSHCDVEASVSNDLPEGSSEAASAKIQNRRGFLVIVSRQSSYWNWRDSPRHLWSTCMHVCVCGCVFVCAVHRPHLSREGQVLPDTLASWLPLHSLVHPGLHVQATRRGKECKRNTDHWADRWIWGTSVNADPFLSRRVLHHIVTSHNFVK